ncbi:MAG TPA: hypothetical protein VJP02_24905 [Candidatus Sulfotelmatobacter sp.]|nr:hypothetical protein [Candidatus Sulfotelmatobacter sp.]
MSLVRKEVGPGSDYQPITTSLYKSSTGTIASVMQADNTCRRKK